MTLTETVDRVYEDTLRQLCTALFQELIQPDATEKYYASAERRFANGLKAAAFARDRTMILIEGNK